MTSLIESSNNNNNNNNILANSDVKGICKDEDFTSSFSNSVCSAYAVFDGHGGKYLSRDMAYGVSLTPSFCKYICTKFLDYDSSITVEDYIKKLFVEYDIILNKYHTGVIGSTATICLVFNNKIYLAYVGDSAALVIKNKNLIYKTINHNIVENPEEKSRLKEANVNTSDTPDFIVTGDETIKVIENKYHEFTFYYLKDQLAMSRAFGHYSIKAYSKSSEDEDFTSKSALLVDPTIFSIDVEEGIEVILGSDGLWDIIKYDNPFNEIISIIEKANQNNENISQAITSFAEARWKQEWIVTNLDNTIYKTKMMYSEQWDDISCYYLKF
jgi:serine/threonine protein phosphatase PrpC